MGLMHSSVQDFGKRYLRRDDCAGAVVVELGSRNVNGSLRGMVMRHQPASYLGIDMEAGDGVDLVLDAIQVPQNLGLAVADLLICTEVLEHAENWRGLVEAAKDVTKPGGMILMTTRGPGFVRHEHPGDYWRFTVQDFSRIFMDCEIRALIQDEQPGHPGVFVMCRKPLIHTPVNLLDIEPAEAPSE